MAGIPKAIDGLVSSAVIAPITGFTARWVQKMAAKGKLPGAYRHGGHWRFDEAIVRRWVEDSRRKEQEWRPFIKEAKSGGVASPTNARNSANLLKQRLGLLPTGGSQNGNPRSKRSVGEKGRAEPTMRP